MDTEKIDPVAAEVSVDPTEQAIAKALVLLWQAFELLKPVLEAVTPAERGKLIPVQHEFTAAAISMFDAIDHAPKLKALCEDRDPGEIARQLRLASLLGPLDNQIELLDTLVSGAHQHTLSSAYLSTLPIYQIAKVAAAIDPTLWAVVNPLKTMYANRKKAPKKGPPSET